eukprot:4252389-Prymnesium_polylepis.1
MARVCVLRVYPVRGGGRVCVLTGYENAAHEQCVLTGYGDAAREHGTRAGRVNDANGGTRGRTTCVCTVIPCRRAMTGVVANKHVVTEHTDGTRTHTLGDPHGGRGRAARAYRAAR